MDRRASPTRGGWHSAQAESRRLPGSCFLAPSLPLFKVTLAHTSKMKFEKQVLDRYGPAQVGFDRLSQRSHRLLWAGFRHPTTKLVSPAAHARCPTSCWRALPEAITMTGKLIFLAGPEKGRTISLGDGATLRIGRGEASDTRLNDRDDEA